MEQSEGILPGQELVEQGLADLSRNELTEYALLVLTAAPRLRRLGVRIPEKHLSQPCEHMLYTCLEKRLGNGAHSYYNSLIRRITSFASALERESAQSDITRSS